MWSSRLFKIYILVVRKSLLFLNISNILKDGLPTSTQIQLDIGKSNGEMILKASNNPAAATVFDSSSKVLDTETGRLIT